MIKEFKRRFRIFLICSSLVALLYVVARILLLNGYGVVPLEQRYLSPESTPLFYFLFMSTSLVALSAVLSLIDIYITNKILYRKPLFKVFLVGSSIQLLLVSLLIIGMDALSHNILNWIAGVHTNHVSAQELILSVIFIFFAIALSRLILEVDRKLGPGNLWKMIIGKFYYPREEDRVFMFIDLKSSTRIAEKLGHIKYSLLLQDCYQDFSVIDKFNAEIYQYVGDEVVISWSLENIKKRRSLVLDAFFAFRDVLEKRKVYYEEEYGVFPEFKAGAHEGLSVVTEVGEVKREITYHGDTLNTTARIQEKCNQFHAELLISDVLWKLLNQQTAYTFKDVGCIPLKGKVNEVRLYKVDQNEI